MVGVETGIKSLEAELEVINYPYEQIPQESFKEAAIDRAVARGRVEQTIPLLNFWEKMAVASLSGAVAFVVGGFGYIGIKAIIENPVLALIPISAGAFYLAGGYDNWKARRNIAP